MSFSHAKKIQLIWAVSLSAFSVIGILYILNCQLKNNIFIFSGWVFVTSSALWTLVVCVWSFPEKDATRDLYHRTSAWNVIKDSRLLYPTADASIYFVDSDKDLSDCRLSVKKVTIVLQGAKRCNEVSPVRAWPLSWRRFKMARGEWTSTKYKRIVLEKFHEVDGKVLVSSFRFECVQGWPLFWLRIRVISISVALCVPLWLIGLSALPYEMQSSNKANWYEYATVQCFLYLFALLICGYFLQPHYNKLVFKNQ